MPTGSLPASGKTLWDKVYQESKTGSCAKNSNPDSCAAQIAWTAVKNAGWSKVGDTWVKKADAVRELSMTFTSVPFDKGAGEMRWKAVASDTDKDLYDDAMSNELYKSFVDNIEKNVPPPEPFGQFVTSNWWKGGTPYLSVSHFSDLDGEAVPGKLDSIYIDGKCLKAKGSFNDTPLGRASWKALNKDFADHIPDDKKIRISIAFLDLAHKHGDGPVFERKSLTSRCKECATGVGDLTYLKGYLVHLAMTRVPVNPRAEMEVEKSMSKKTREEDAASIVGEEEAKKLAEKSALVGRSDILVEKAETDVIVEEAKKEDVPVEVKAEVLPEVPPVEPVIDTVSNVETLIEPEKPAEPIVPEQVIMPLNSELKALSIAVSKVMSAPATPQEKMAMIEPELKNLGTAIERSFSSSEAEQPKVETSVVTMETVRSLIEESNKPVMDTLTSIQVALAGLNRPTVEKSEVIRITPKPRSPDPSIMRSLVAKLNGEVKPKSVLDICRTSVGLQSSND